ncbi:alpha/beta hydrolase [uncultured Marivirga sp.]|uniref:alpha/beta hydrolase family protein n=1 Tax=uncultured Marivirga sp. TaxID=1123707 RepID=UPI0030EBF417|tara:strand:- start:107884 stop:109278 length:1395 start_codon:yes stop_codon:yes gene_type:complete
MKKLSSIALFTILSSALWAQNIEGKWQGLLKLQGIELTIVFNIMGQEDTLAATMDSPDQGAFGLAVQKISFQDNQLEMKMSMPSIQYQGILNSKGEIEGTFKQAGAELSLVLTQNEIRKSIKKKPQDPIEPFPYRSQEIIFENSVADIKLAGTFTMPSEGDIFPAVVLISGSGPQDRNEALLGHKPFLVLSDHLTRQGIAVLRFDDRGTAESEGDFSAATSADFKTDVAAAVDYLKSQMQIRSIGLIGHSEGGIIAPMLAAESEDVDFIVLMAGTGIRGDELLVRQSELIGRAAGMKEVELKKARDFNRGAYAAVVNNSNDETVKQDLRKYLEESVAKNPELATANGLTEQIFVDQILAQLTSPWMMYFLKYDPAEALKKVDCPVLAVIGEKDLQVPAKVNLEAIEKALKAGGNSQYTVKKLEKLNHLFQEAETGAPSEYANIEQTIAPEALELISDWILQQVK